MRAPSGPRCYDDVYHYTNEVFTTLARDATRLTLTDERRNDWLDMAAMSGNLVVSLGAARTSKADGVAFLKIGAGTYIENAVTGDGNDNIIGNGLATVSTACAAMTPSTAGRCRHALRRRGQRYADRRMQPRMSSCSTARSMR